MIYREIQRERVCERETERERERVCERETERERKIQREAGEYRKK